MLCVSHWGFMHFFLGAAIFREEFAPAHLPALYRMSHINTGITIFEQRRDYRDRGRRASTAGRSHLERPGPPMRVIDGHNDALLRAWEGGGVASLLDGDGAVTVAAAREGGLAAGLFAVFAPSPGDWNVGGGVDGSWEVAPIAELRWAQAAPAAAEIAAMAFALVRDGGARLVKDIADLDACLEADGPLGLILHMEGAEAIGEGLEELDLWYAAGLRSLGPVWSRPNRFGQRRAVQVPVVARHGPRAHAARPRGSSSAAPSSASPSTSRT